MEYFDKYKKDLIPIYQPTASPEFIVLGRNMAYSQNYLLVRQCYSSFTDFKNRLCKYFGGTKRFNLDMRNYLLAKIDN
ncbi:MAG: hypothetical protein MRJ93_04810 [Nitrososphaeraceae archaeon]|nr:hypothetical protein [Nitrososphaeraceae archaeon]